MHTEIAEPIAAGMDDAERLSGIGRTELYELIKQGKIEARKHGRRTLIVVASLRNYLNSLPPYDPRVAAAKLRRAVEGRQAMRRARRDGRI
jgi:hypothetical protein